jgi:branched-chain amino acid transport system substrate-binding protein
MNRNRHGCLKRIGRGPSSYGPPHIATVALLLPLLASPCAQAVEFLIGHVAPFSGSLASTSRDYNIGLLVCAAEANNKSGPGGNTIRIISSDDGFSPEETKRRAGEMLANENTIALVGLTGAENVKAVVESKALQTAQISVVGVRSGSADMRTQKSLFFLRPTVNEEIAKVIDQLAAYGLKRIGVVHREDATGLQELAIAKDEAARRGMTIVASGAYKPKSVDLSAAAAALDSPSIQAVLLVADTQASAEFAKKFRQTNKSAFIAATSDTEIELLVQLMGADASRGIAVVQTVPSPYREIAPITREFRKLMVELNMPAEKINYATLEGYLACRVISRALGQAGKKPGRAALTAALERMQRTDIGGFLVDFSAQQRTGSHYLQVSVIGPKGRPLE